MFFCFILFKFGSEALFILRELSHFDIATPGVTSCMFTGPGYLTYVALQLFRLS